MSSEGIVNSANIWQLFPRRWISEKLGRLLGLFLKSREAMTWPIPYGMHLRSKLVRSFYQLKFSGDIKFIDVSLEDITSPKGAR